MTCPRVNLQTEIKGMIFVSYTPILVRTHMHLPSSRPGARPRKRLYERGRTPQPSVVAATDAGAGARAGASDAAGAIVGPSQHSMFLTLTRQFSLIYAVSSNA